MVGCKAILVDTAFSQSYSLRESVLLAAPPDFGTGFVAVSVLVYKKCSGKMLRHVLGSYRERMVYGKSKKNGIFLSELWI